MKAGDPRNAPAEVDDLLRLFDTEPLDFQPATDYHYSNSSYILLGAVIEKASGMGYGKYVERNLLWPLGLRNIVYGGGLALIRGGRPVI